MCHNQIPHPSLAQGGMNQLGANATDRPHQRERHELTNNSLKVCMLERIDFHFLKKKKKKGVLAWKAANETRKGIKLHPEAHRHAPPASAVLRAQISQILHQQPSAGSCWRRGTPFHAATSPPAQHSVSNVPISAHTECSSISRLHSKHPRAPSFASQQGLHSKYPY